MCFRKKTAEVAGADRRGIQRSIKAKVDELLMSSGYEDVGIVIQDILFEIAKSPASPPTQQETTTTVTKDFEQLGKTQQWRRAKKVEDNITASNPQYTDPSEMVAVLKKVITSTERKMEEKGT